MTSGPFEGIFNFYQDLWEGIKFASKWAKKAMFRRKLYKYQSEKKYLQKGDYIEAQDKSRGHVWKVFVDIGTGIPVGCAVYWDEEHGGSFISPVIPVEDKSPKFNPFIRKYQFKENK